MEHQQPRKEFKKMTLNLIGMEKTAKEIRIQEEGRLDYIVIQVDSNGGPISGQSFNGLGDFENNLSEERLEKLRAHHKIKQQTKPLAG
jgi:hypothetical protein